MGIWNLTQAGFQMVQKRFCWKFWISNGTWNPDQTIWNLAQWPPCCQKPFEIRTKTSRFWMVQFSNGWEYSYNHRKSPTIWKLDHLKSDLQKVWISNVSGFQNVRFQISTTVLFIDALRQSQTFLPPKIFSKVLLYPLHHTVDNYEPFLVLFQASKYLDENSRYEILELLGQLEGELQAKDIAIATLKVSW